MFFFVKHWSKEYFHITVIQETEVRFPSDCLDYNMLQPSFVYRKPVLKHPGKPKISFPYPLCRNGCRAGVATLNHRPRELCCHRTAGACAWPPTPLTQTDFPVWYRNCLVPGIPPGDPCPVADPAMASGPALSRSHWLVFQASPQPYLITRNLSDLFTEPGVNSFILWTLFLSPDPPCLDPEGGGWAPHAARFVSRLCPDSLVLMASHPLLGLAVTLELGVQTGWPQNKGLAPC